MENILDLLKEVQCSNPLQIWIPSKGKFLNFKHLTFQQHNKFLSLDIQESNENVDLIDYQVKFNNVLNEIIRENVLDVFQSEADKEFTIIDRDAIAIQLRILLDDNFQIKTGDKTNVVSLSAQLHSIYNIGINDFERNVTFVYKNMKITLDLPSIYVDSIVSNEVSTLNIDKNDFPAFILLTETIKFIKTLEFNKNSSPIVFNLFEKSNISESIVLCQALPLPLLSKVSEYIQKIQKINEKITTFTYNVDGQDISIPIIINSQWFTNF